MKTYEEYKDDFLISTDKSKLNIAVIHHYLSTASYWAKNIPLQKVQRCIEHSFCFGVYKNNQQAGFARLITDYTTYAYLADVFILDEYRCMGLSKWLMQFITTNAEVQGLRRWMLATQDAHGLYSQFGFTPPDKPERIMQRRDMESY
jgi:N-acetylglutamate synthase-like GNAT family acetyltransferase